MGEIIFILLIIGYVASWVFYWHDRRRRYRPMTEEDFAELEQMIEAYKSKGKDSMNTLPK